MPIMHPIERPVCKHPKDQREVVTLGDIRHEGGEVVDDVREVEICGVCGIELVEEEEFNYPF